MGSIISRVSQLIQENKNFALCIVTYTEGSSPRKAGSKMIVYEDGTSEGSIGGGSIEKLLLKHALTLLSWAKLPNILIILKMIYLCNVVA